MAALDEFCQSKFWDVNLTWYTDNPDFTECFHHTALAWLPCAVLWLFLPVEIGVYRKSKSLSIPWTTLSVVKIIIAVILALICTIEIIYVNQVTSSITPALTLGAAINLVTYLLVVALVVLGRKYGVQSSGVLFNYWLVSVITGFITYWSLLKTLEVEFVINDTFLFTLYMVRYPLVLSMFILTFVADERASYSGRYPNLDENESPEITASFYSKLLFAWLNQLIWKGFRNPLQFKDLYSCNYGEKADTITRRFEKHWKLPSEETSPRLNNIGNGYAETELRGFTTEAIDAIAVRPKPRTKLSIVPAMVKSYWTFFLSFAYLRLVCDLLGFTNPLILKLLIEFASSDEPTWKGYFYICLLFLTSVLQFVCLGAHYRRASKLGLRLRSMCMAVIYKKTLRLSNAARRNLTMGVILNAMSVDSDRFTLLMFEINLIWSAPLQIGLALYFLYEVIGVAVFSGLAVILLMMPLNGVIARQIKKLQAKVMKCKDQRVKLMSEILNGIKVLKLYGWEQSFREKVLELREKEMKLMRKMAYLNASSTSLWLLTPFLVALVSFATFVLIDEANVLTATTAFVSLRLFNILKNPLADLPELINLLLVARVGINRINSVLNSEEVEEYVQEVTGADVQNVVSVNNASFSWDGTEQVLKDIDVKVAKGSLVAVVGQVGCGKSSLISAILGDMVKVKGSVQVQGSIAYVPQQAWIQNASLQNNIIFDQKLIVKRYQEIVSACTLDVDFGILPAKDSTEIGEKGINLSGGQKQRVSLARAVYRNSDIYLLDDPLGAVDSHVGKHIFDNVLGPKGLLKDKTRILVTHSVTFLPEVDVILVMKDGRISEIGSYLEIISSNGAFKDFLAQHVTDEIQRDEDVDIKSISMSRQVSQVSRVSATTRSSESLAKKQDGKQLVEAERETRGSMSWLVYKEYFNAMRYFWCAIIIIGFVAQQGFSVGSSFWLTVWSQDADVANYTVDTSTRDLRLSVYGVLGVLQSVTLLFSVILLEVTALTAATTLHNNMLGSVLRSPMSFFDTTPMGRILNRFAKDVEGTDSQLPKLMRRFIVTFTQIIGFLLAIIIEIPIFVVAVFPIAGIYGLAQRLYLSTNRQLKRMEANSRSPLYAHFSETLSGVSSIRAYGATSRFIQKAFTYIDNNCVMNYLSRSANRWLSLRLDLVGSVMLFFAGLVTVLAKGNISPGSVGFIITNANNLLSILYAVVLVSTLLEANLVSVERLSEYSNLTTEADWKKEGQLSPAWPELGKITFQNYSTRYREGLDMVLNNISCVINPSEKVGIVGRTGAGKSSLTLALFRIVEPVNGHIFIDGKDISQLGLFDLRTQLTIIPQDPVLFSGTLRLNLDPFENCTDEQLWTALELAHLKSFFHTVDKGLDFDISEGGENLSVGQRQLVCLARALLRKTKILVLDEATASVDLDTDDLIQATIRKEFRDSTVVTIAHRLNTIMDYDRVMVLDKGSIVEYDTTPTLLQNKKSVFHGMARDAGLV